MPTETTASPREHVRWVARMGREDFRRFSHLIAEVIASAGSQLSRPRVEAGSSSIARRHGQDAR
jgi:hypothetical protein